jgi:AcrR family transcriptional regulator
MAKPRRTARTDFPLHGESRTPAAVMGTRAKRTSMLIMENAREVFLQKGYYGATIDDIVDAAGISRSSFYTYFPTKRDVLLMLGTDTYEAMNDLIEKMSIVADEDPPDAVERIVRMYIDLLDVHGAFLQVWGQAGFGDEELRKTGMRVKLATARRFAAVLKRLGWDPGDDDPALVSFAFEAMIDRFWFYEKVAGLPATDDEMVATLSSIIGRAIGRKRRPATGRKNASS